jgi:hypothetical protein
MAKSSHRPLTPEELAKDERAFQAMLRLAKYMPPDVAQNIRSLQSHFDQMRASQVATAEQDAALAVIRERLRRAEGEFHKAILGARREVVAQYGEDSDEAQAMRIKKPSGNKPKRSRSKPGNSKQQR